jgi:putative transposase
MVQDAPDTVIMAEDEAWMYLQATTMNVWSPRGQTPIVRVHPGRDKVGYYGTLNLHTQREIVTRTSVFNAETSAQHLQQVLEANPGKPILLFWDRATWHFGEPIRRVLAAHPRLEIMYFPVAAPDLNPQELVWKQTRRTVSHNHLTPKLAQLADDFEHYLNSHTFESSFLERYGFNLVYPILN